MTVNSLAKDIFYADLPGFSGFDHFSDAHCYAALPPDWFVVITDVQGSTRAIEEGRYKQVNALGAASIIALLNAVDKRCPLKPPNVHLDTGPLEFLLIKRCHLIDYGATRWIHELKSERRAVFVPNAV